MRNWQAWHDEYDEPASSLSRRLAEVRSQLSSLLDQASPGSRVSLLSLCAGDGRDTVPVVAASHRRVDACLVELDPDLAGGARRAAEAAGLDVDVRTGDAGETATFADRLPVDVLMLCGVFGNVPDDHVARTVRAAAAMVTPRGAVVWTRGHRVPDDPTLHVADPAAWVRDLFTASGFEEVAFVRPEDASYRVGVARLGQGVDRRQSGPLPERLFSFEEVTAGPALDGWARFPNMGVVLSTPGFTFR